MPNPQITFCYCSKTTSSPSNTPTKQLSCYDSTLNKNNSTIPVQSILCGKNGQSIIPTAKLRMTQDLLRQHLQNWLIINEWQDSQSPLLWHQCRWIKGVEPGPARWLGDHVTAESFSRSALWVNTAHNAEVGVQMTHCEQEMSDTWKTV